MEIINQTNQTNTQSAELSKLKDYLIGMINRQLEANSGIVGDRRKMIERSLQEVYRSTKLSLPNTIREQLFHEILDDMLGFGLLQQFLDDPEISEIMVNGPQKIYVERKGKLIKTNVVFDNDAQVLKIIERIIVPLGRRIDYDRPTVDARLPDGSRVNAVIAPVAIDGPTITIRKFQKGKLSVDQLIEYGSITRNMADFVRACVIGRLNIIVSGGTGSGKTTLLNVLSSFIPENERIITIEDAAELQLQQEHVLRLETKTNSLDGTNDVTVRDLVRNSLRMRPDRIVVGE